MNNHRLLILLLIQFGTLLFARTNDDVLVVVNDATVAENGTKGIGASQFVADYYVAARSIPKRNVVHISAKGCCGFADGASSQLYNNTPVSPEQFTSEISQPIKTFLEKRHLKQQIKYIVMTYGVPTHIGQLPPFEGLSLDSFVSQMYLVDGQGKSISLRPRNVNPPFNADPLSKPTAWSNSAVSTPVYF